MAFVADNLSLSLSLNGLMGRAQRAVSNFFAAPDHSPEQDLLSANMRDARLAPRVPMSNANLDAGLLSQLSSIGLKRGKEVTDQTHPELMQAWRAMSKRAGLAKPPQLIIAESDTPNALTVTKDEVTITTGLLKFLDLREAVAVLGHELGHVQSDHITPRQMTTLVFGGTGAVIGNEMSRHSNVVRRLEPHINKFGPTRKLWSWIHPNGIQANNSFIGSAAVVSISAGLGAMVGRHFSVRPTELDADRKGAAISGDPLALASALEQLQRHTPRKGIMNTVAQIRSGYPSTEKRIAGLKRIANEQGTGTPVVDSVENQPQPKKHHEAPTVQPSAAVSQVVAAERVAPELAQPQLS